MECKACGAWFSSTNKNDSLCSACQRAMDRLGIDFSYDRLLALISQRMTLRDEVEERMRIVGSIDIDRLKELVHAEKEGRIRISPKRTTCGMCANFVPIEGKSGGRCKIKKYRVDRFGIEHKEEGPLIVPKSKAACRKCKEVKK